MPVADLRPDPLGRFLDERRDRPVARAAADVVGEVPQDLEAVIGVRHLGVEQQRVELTLRRFHRGDRRRGAGGRDRKSRRHGRHVVAVARPDAQLCRELAKQLRRRRDRARCRVTRTSAWPNSRWPERRTSPPSTSVISCMP